MPGTGSVSGEETAERNTMYPVGLPVAAVQDVVMVVAVTAENTSGVGAIAIYVTPLNAIVDSP